MTDSLRESWHLVGRLRQIVRVLAHHGFYEVLKRLSLHRRLSALERLRYARLHRKEDVSAAAHLRQACEEQGNRGLPHRFVQMFMGIAGAFMLSGVAHAFHTETHLSEELPPHRLVYQFNKADPEYQRAILFSVGEMVRKYGDDIHLVVTVIGPGIHILAKEPKRPVPQEIRERVTSLAMYGVSFHACGNTLRSLGWTKEDLLDFATVVDVGADDLMRLQEQGYVYISW